MEANLSVLEWISFGLGVALGLGCTVATISCSLFLKRNGIEVSFFFSGSPYYLRRKYLQGLAEQRTRFRDLVFLFACVSLPVAMLLMFLALKDVARN